MGTNTDEARRAAVIVPPAEGATREDLQRLLYEIWCRTPTREKLPTFGVQTARALVFLRRYAVPVYRSRQHAACRALEQQRLCPSRVRIALAYALPVGATVAIVGTSQCAVIIHVEACQDEGDPSPAPWYVAAVPGRRNCEVFGADELEMA